MTDPAAASTGPARADPFVRYEARVLDPSKAVRPPGGTAPAITVYRGDFLLITAASRPEAEQLIATVVAIAAGLNLQLTGPDVFVEIDGAEGDSAATPDVVAHNRLARLLALAEPAGIPLVVPVRFASTLDGPAPAVDVWPLLQAVRAADPDRGRLVGLDHLMFSAAVIAGNPFTRGTAVIGGSPFTRGTASIGGSPFTRGTASGVESYLAGGSGGHGPVSVVLAAPVRSAEACHPHVVVLDTGIGEHPWFQAAPVSRRLLLDNGDPIGMDVDDPSVMATDPEGAGAISDPLTGLLDTHAGHGTFIAGLIRQRCPDADITALRIMNGDGVVAEDELTRGLTGLGVRLAEGGCSVEALVVSLGYYAESGDDLSYTAGLELLLLDLAARGVATFAAAGNDCTDRRSYPAAFADHAEFAAPGVVPLLAVAALNPDRSVALFSNDASWVNAEAAGANVVSTAPVLASGAWSADTSLLGPNGERRGTIDPDRFSSGFATWSGTSFAAPVLAGEYVATLVEAGCPTSADQRAALVPRRKPASDKGDSP